MTTSKKPKKDPVESKPVDKVTDEEKEHNAQLIVKSQEGQEALAQAERALTEAQAFVIGIEASIQDWMSYLQKKYNLPDLTGVDIEGNINRPD